jgi:hypothetical protein
VRYELHILLCRTRRIGRLVACLWPRTPGFDPGSVHVRFVMAEEAMEQSFLETLGIRPHQCYTYDTDKRPKPGILLGKQYPFRNRGTVYQTAFAPSVCTWSDTWPQETWGSTRSLPLPPEHGSSNLRNINLRDLSISQRCCWRFKSRGMWRSVVGVTVPDVLKDSTAFFPHCLTVNIKALRPFETSGNTKRCSVISNKTCLHSLPLSHLTDTAHIPHLCMSVFHLHLPITTVAPHAYPRQVLFHPNVFRLLAPTAARQPPTRVTKQSLFYSSRFSVSLFFTNKAAIDRSIDATKSNSHHAVRRTSTNSSQNFRLLQLRKQNDTQTLFTSQGTTWQWRGYSLSSSSGNRTWTVDWLPLKMMAQSFETSGARCPAIQRHIPEDSNPQHRLQLLNPVWIFWTSGIQPFLFAYPHI